uniref:Cell division protein SepF n=1 Tax=Cyanothece sp. (strain PCC 7425 / ATCC 29141) TaxID=395961 RepID=SEPF_CYAP4|nr:RecName: Full=Cell division protein SepF [Cyanothece sp. PCC 7425]
MSSIFGKLREFVGFGEPTGYDYDYDEMEGDDYQGLYPAEPAQSLPTRSEEPHPRPSEPEMRSPVNTSAVTSTAMNPPMNQSMNNVVGMPGSGKWWGAVAEVIVMEPRSFEEMPQVIQALRERKSVVLNLTMMEPDQAQRAVDFVAGATYTIDGHQERIGESIFLFTPSCVQVSTQAGGQSHTLRDIPQAQIHTRPPAPAWTAEPLSRIAQ